MNLKNYYEKAITYDGYTDLLGENLELHNHHYKKFELSQDQQARIQSLMPLNILVITEPWCGDSLAIFPVIKKVSEIHGVWDVRVALRDQNPDLIDQFLTRGGRAVPIFLFLDKDYQLILKWGPRPKEIQQIFEDHRSQIQEGKIEKSEVIKKIRNFYSRNRGKVICEDLLVSLEAVL